VNYDGFHKMTDEAAEVVTFEKMPRPGSSADFASWLVPARNNIQREILRLRPVLTAESYVGFPISAEPQTRNGGRY
jgi:hypothetical protein